MFFWRLVTIGFTGFCLGFSTASAEDLTECPNPVFECIGPGPGGTPPGDPPDPIFKPVYPLVENGTDFNRSFGVIQNGSVTMSNGTPTISRELSEYLERHRKLIDPNAVYLLSPKSVDQNGIVGDGLFVGGGALTQ